MLYVANIDKRYVLREMNRANLTDLCIRAYVFCEQYDKHFVPAWTYNAVPGQKKTMKQAIGDVTKILEGYPRATIIESKATKSEIGEGFYSTYPKLAVDVALCRVGLLN